MAAEDYILLKQIKATLSYLQGSGRKREKMSIIKVDYGEIGGGSQYTNVDAILVAANSSNTYNIDSTKNYIITYSDTDGGLQDRSIVWEYKLGIKNVIKAGSGVGITLSDTGLTLTFRNSNLTDKAVAMILYE